MLYSVYKMTTERVNTMKIKMTKTEERELIANLSKTVKIVRYATVMTNVKTFRNSSSVANRGHKRVALTQRGIYSGRS